MKITREEAILKLHEWTKNPALINHAYMVEAVMMKAAHKYGRGAIDEIEWGLAGLLHDADYEKWPNEHPNKIVAWLKEKQEEIIAHAISCHYSKWQVSYLRQIDKALLACDELTGFIGACCHIRPGGITSLNSKSV